MERLIRLSWIGDTIPVNGRSPEADMPLAGTGSNDDSILEVIDSADSPPMINGLGISLDGDPGIGLNGS